MNDLDTRIRIEVEHANVTARRLGITLDQALLAIIAARHARAEDTTRALLYRLDRIPAPSEVSGG